MLLMSPLKSEGVAGPPGLDLIPAPTPERSRELAMPSPAGSSLLHMVKGESTDRSLS